MLHLHSDCQITRRKRYYLVTSTDDDGTFRTAYLDDAIEHIWAREATEVELVTPRYIATISNIRPHPPTE